MALNLKSRALAVGLTGILAVGVIGGATAAFAHDGDGPPPRHPIARHFLRHHPALVGVKAIMNHCDLTRADLRAGAQAGQTINEVLEAKGQDPAQCKADILAALDERLTTAVENGKITEERKANILEKASTGLDRLMSHVLGSNRPRASRD